MLRKSLLTLLTLAALGTLALLIASYVGAPRPRPAPTTADVRQAIHEDNASLFELIKPRTDFWPSPRYTLNVSARRGWLRFKRSTNYCLTCGCLPPNHATHRWLGCFYGHHGVTVDYSYSFNSPLPVENRIAFPGVKWTTYLLFGARHNSLAISLWPPFALFAIYPVIAFTRGPLRRHRRRRRGLCLQCGYNLTGNVTGRCPECGTNA